MELTPAEREKICYQFDAFVKKLLRNEMLSYSAHLKWRYTHELSLSSLASDWIEGFCVWDEYPSNYAYFNVCGQSIAVRDNRLAQALFGLAEDKRNIVLLAYYLDMSDREIAERLNSVRSTIQYKRMNSLKELKQRMGADKDGE